MLENINENLLTYLPFFRTLVTKTVCVTLDPSKKTFLY